MSQENKEDLATSSLHLTANGNDKENEILPHLTPMMYILMYKTFLVVLLLQNTMVLTTDKINGSA